MNAITTIVKRLKDYLPFIVAVNISVGYININIHYRYFYNFDISSYLNTSEIITFGILSIGNFSAIDFVTVVVTTYLLLFVNVARIGDTSMVHKYLYYTLVIIMTFKPIGIILYLEFIEHFRFMYSTQDYMLILIAVIIISLIASYLICGNTEIPVSSSKTLIFYALFATYSSTFFSSFKHGAEIRYSKKFNGTVLNTKQGMYFDSDSVRYTGRNSSYTFLYLPVDSCIIPIPNDEIINQKIKMNRDRTTILRQSPF